MRRGTGEHVVNALDHEDLLRTSEHENKQGRVSLASYSIRWGNDYRVEIESKVSAVPATRTCSNSVTAAELKRAFSSS